MELNVFIRMLMNNGSVKKKKQKYNFQEKIWLEQGMAIRRDEDNRKFAQYLEKNGKTFKEISNIMEISIDEIKRLLSI